MNEAVRSYIYGITLERGFPPTLEEAGKHFAAGIPEMRQKFKELADAHVLVLQKDCSEILMANPFSAVPTPFLVELEKFSCFGNCIWDALGIPAMLKQDATHRGFVRRLRFLNEGAGPERLAARRLRLDSLRDSGAPVVG